MKTYKKIHYWVLALVAIALFVVSAMGVRLGKSSTLDFDRVDNHIARLTEFGEHNYLTPDTQVDAREYILQSLRDMGILENPYEVASDKLDSDFYNSVGYIDNAPTFVLQKAIPNQATNDKILEQDGAVMVDATVDNIVVAFPSASTQAGDISDSVVFAVDYDTQAGHVGASGTNANVAVVLESIKQLAESKQSLQNDVVFLFGESRDQNVGLYLYDNQFDGFKGVANRTSVAIGLHSFGTTGDVALYETSDNNTNLLQNLVLSGTASSSYIQHFFEQSKYKQGTNNFSFDFANYGNFGDTSFARSPQDKMDGVSRATLVSKASLIQKSIDRFGNNKIADLSAGQNGAYAEYLGVGFQIPVIANMIAGGVILALAVLAVILLVRNHGSKEDPKRHMKGKTLRNAIVASVCALLGVGVFALGFYYVFGVWLLVGFGVVPLAGLHTFAMSKPLLLVVLFLLSFAVYNALIGALKRAFNIRSVDVSRANALLLALGAGIAALVVPVLAAPLLLVSLLQMIALVLSVVFKNKMRKSCAFDIDRLFLTFVPVALCLPLIVPSILVAGVFVALPYYAVLAMVVALLMGSITPFFGMVEQKLNKLVGKLPGYTKKYVSTEIVKTVVEPVASAPSLVGKPRANKTVVRSRVKTISKDVQKSKFRYRTYVLTGLLTIVASILLVVGTLPAKAVGANTDTLGYHGIYENAMVFVYDNQSDGSGLEWQIKDKSVYNIVSQVLGGFRYDSNKGAYTLPITKAREGFSAPSKSASGSAGATWQVFEAYNSQVSVTVKGAENISRFTFSAQGSEYIYQNTEGRDTLSFNLPFWFGNSSTISVDTEGTGSVSYEYVQYTYSEQELVNYADWTKLVAYLNDHNMAGAVRGAIVCKVK